MIQPGAETPRETDSQSVAPDGRPMDAQPRWRRDFPIEWARDEYVARRDFVKFVVLTSAAFVAGQLWVLWKSVRRRRAPELPVLAIAGVEDLPIGGAKTFAYPEGSPPRLLVRTGESSFVAYDQQCTHLLCPVVPVIEQRRLHCPCHNGWFDLETGRVIAGPPQRPLTRVQLEVREGSVFATGIEAPL